MFQEGDCESTSSSLMRYCLCTRAVQPLDLFWDSKDPQSSKPIRVCSFPAYTIRVKRAPKLSPDLQPLAAFIWRNLPCLWVIYSSHPTPSPTLLMHSLVQAAVDIHHAALPLLPRPLRLRPSDQLS
jgi:hypothetical protein